MSKPWLGYLSAFLLLLAGILQIAGGSPKTGALFIVISAISVILKLYIQKKSRSDNP
jgi:hypothetical protein